MTKAMYFKMSLEMPKDLISKIANDKIRDEKKRCLRKSLRACGFKIHTGLDGMDFVNELTTVVIRYKVYKISRIIKNNYHDTNIYLKKGRHSDCQLRLKLRSKT